MTRRSSTDHVVQLAAAAGAGELLDDELADVPDELDDESDFDDSDFDDSDFDDFDEAESALAVVDADDELRLSVR